MACLTCEHNDCSDTTELEQAHSMVAVLQKVDANGYSFFQCEGGQDFNFMNWQHFHCSQEHMRANFITCLQEHYTEDALHTTPIGGGATILHKIVLGSSLVCKICQAPLTTTAYRFCLTVFTPINSVPDNHMNGLAEWCCSLDHARQSATSIVANINY